MSSIRSLFAKIFAAIIARKVNNWASNPIDTQERVFKKLIKSAIDTKFGIDHNFKSINNHLDYISRVPIRDYEGLKPYIEKVIDGESDVLWNGKPLYFAKTSGTTSGSKHIPITDVSIKEELKKNTEVMKEDKVKDDK